MKRGFKYKPSCLGGTLQAYGLDDLLFDLVEEATKEKRCYHSLCFIIFFLILFFFFIVQLLIIRNVSNPNRVVECTFTCAATSQVLTNIKTYFFLCLSRCDYCSEWITRANGEGLLQGQLTDELQRGLSPSPNDESGGGQRNNSNIQEAFRNLL